MRAIVCTSSGGPEVLRLETGVADPKAAKGELVIVVKASALNGADLMQRQGMYPPPPGRAHALCTAVILIVSSAVIGA